MSERPTLLIDRCLGGHLLAAELRALGWSVECLDAHFHQAEKDEVWLVQCAARGWLILTQDAQIGRRAHEVAAVASSGARVVVLASVLPRAMAVAAIERAADRLTAHFHHKPAPFMLKLYRDGAVKVWRDRGALVGLVGEGSGEAG